MYHKYPLCQPYDPFTEHPVLYNETFLPAAITVSLRPFHIAQDLPLINNWFNAQFDKSKDPRDPFQYTGDYYTTLLTGSNSQPLLGSIDQKPVFQVDIYQAMLAPDSLLEANPFSQNDFVIQLLLSPESMQNLPATLYSLLACLDCFFRHEEVHRITWMVNTRDKNFRFIASLAEMDELQCEDELQTYFIISKERFRQVQFTLPLYPREQTVTING
jgi:hypothetical protein